MKKIIYTTASILSLFLCYIYFYTTSVETLDIVIQDKEVVTKSSRNSIDSKYLIFTKDEVFENEDSFIFGKFNSSDFQNQLELNKKYKVEVVGWRVPLLSMYRNIIEINRSVR